MEYYLALQKKGILQYVTTMLNLEYITLSEIRSQSQKDTAWFQLYEVSKVKDEGSVDWD